MNYYSISETETIIGSLALKEVAEAKVSMKSKFCTVGANECYSISMFSNSIVPLKLFPPPLLLIAEDAGTPCELIEFRD